MDKVRTEEKGGRADDDAHAEARHRVLAAGGGCGGRKRGYWYRRRRRGRCVRGRACDSNERAVNSSSICVLGARLYGPPAPSLRSRLATANRTTECARIPTATMLSSVLRKESRSMAARAVHCRSRQQTAWRALSTASSDQPSTSSPGPSSIPWFIDPSEAESPSLSPYARKASVPQAPTRPLAPLPSTLPQNHPIMRLHAELKSSPHLEPGTLLVREPIPTAVGPPLPDAIPRGRRKRGRTDLGEGVTEDVGGIWDWLVIAQVRSCAIFVPFSTHRLFDRSRRALRTVGRLSRLFE